MRLEELLRSLSCFDSNLARVSINNSPNHLAKNLLSLNWFESPIRIPYIKNYFRGCVLQPNFPLLLSHSVLGQQERKLHIYIFSEHLVLAGMNSVQCVKSYLGLA